jgi:hypothetical protein
MISKFVIWVQAQAWKLGTGAALATAVTLAVALGVCSVQKGRAETARDALAASIDAPLTGWAARLSQCSANVDVLDDAIDGQNRVIEEAGKASTARLAEAAKSVAAARRDQVQSDAKIAVLMKPLVGADTCLRVIEADERLMRSLKP